jgi:hypothetical protein
VPRDAASAVASPDVIPITSCVLLESRNRVFNWEICLGTNSRWARWIGCTIGLARELLNARVPDGVPLDLAVTPPKWLLRTVLREWSDPPPPNAAAFSRLLPGLWRRPWELKAALAGRWRNSVQATVDCNGAFNALPRWPYQVRDVAARARHFLASSPIISPNVHGESARPPSHWILNKSSHELPRTPKCIGESSTRVHWRSQPGKHPRTGVLLRGAATLGANERTVFSGSRIH